MSGEEAERNRDGTYAKVESEGGMDDFTQFQLKEYENISQAHFKTNEVLATFYRYFLLITAIPITTIGLALMKLSEDGISPEGRFLAHFIFGLSVMLLSLVGAAVISYIEGLRLDAILYARVVNSIRDYFFNKPGAEFFGPPVLPRRRDRPSYGGQGASFTMYFICAAMNAVYFSCGLLILLIDRTTPLVSLKISNCQWAIAFGAFVALMVIQAYLRRQLIAGKSTKGF